MLRLLHPKSRTRGFHRPGQWLFVCTALRLHGHGCWSLGSEAARVLGVLSGLEKGCWACHLLNKLYKLQPSGNYESQSVPVKLERALADAEATAVAEPVVSQRLWVMESKCHVGGGCWCQRKAKQKRL